MDNRNEEKDFRKDFPIFQQEKELIYLDNAATSQRPACVLEAERNFYEKTNANPLRGLYELGLEATDAYEKARKCVQGFLHAGKAEEIIFTRNTTEALNLVAYSYGLNRLGPGDEILVSIMEHHSNLLPWQMVSRRTGAELRFLECGQDGELTEEQIRKAFTPRTRLAATTQVSNVFGRENPIKEIVRIAHEHGAVVVADAAQSAPHIPINVQELDVDFLAFSGHKLMAPMGIGVLYGKEELLQDMPPFLTGGEMIERDGKCCRSRGVGRCNQVSGRNRLENPSGKGKPAHGPRIGTDGANSGNSCPGLPGCRGTLRDPYLYGGGCPSP